MNNIPKYKHYIRTTQGKKAINETIFCLITTTKAWTKRRFLGNPPPINPFKPRLLLRTSFRPPAPTEMAQKKPPNFRQNKRRTLRGFWENASAFLKKAKERTYFIHPQTSAFVPSCGGRTAMHRRREKHH